MDGNPGLLAALRTCLPSVPIQRCTVHKLRNISNHCLRAIQASVVADAKRIIYATSKKEALEELKPGKKDIRVLLLKPLPVLRKILKVLSSLWTSDTRYGHLFVLLTSLRECSGSSLRRINTMDTFPTEKSLYPYNVLVSSVIKRKLGG